MIGYARFPIRRLAGIDLFDPVGRRQILGAQTDGTCIADRLKRQRVASFLPGVRADHRQIFFAVGIVEKFDLIIFNGERTDRFEIGVLVEKFEYAVV